MIQVKGFTIYNLIYRIKPVRYQRALLGSVQNLRPKHFDDFLEPMKFYCVQ